MQRMRSLWGLTGIVLHWGWSRKREFKFSKLDDGDRKAFLHFARTLPFQAHVLVTQKQAYVSDQSDFYARMLCDALQHASSTIAGGIVLWDESVTATKWKQKVTTHIRQRLNTHNCHLIHDMGFGASDRHNLLQLADMIAGALHRKHEDGDDAFASIIAGQVMLAAR